MLEMKDMDREDYPIVAEYVRDMYEGSEVSVYKTNIIVNNCVYSLSECEVQRKCMYGNILIGYYGLKQIGARIEVVSCYIDKKYRSVKVTKMFIRELMRHIPEGTEAVTHKLRYLDNIADSLMIGTSKLDWDRIVDLSKRM